MSPLAILSLCRRIGANTVLTTDHVDATNSDKVDKTVDRTLTAIRKNCTIGGEAAAMGMSAGTAVGGTLVWTRVMVDISEQIPAKTVKISAVGVCI